MKTILFSGAAALALLTGPVFAETASTPTEHQQTRALNDGGATGTYAAPDALNGETGPAPQTAPAQQALDHPPEGANFDPRDFIALATVDPDRLRGATVEDSTGTPVGRVVGVRLGKNGMPAQVRVELADGMHVRVGQASLRFNPSQDILLTNIDLGQLRSMARE